MAYSFPKSEHATGNAVDITTFTLEDGKTIHVADARDLSATSYQLLRGLRTTACGYFSTVLGPGSNAAHASQFHFDMGRHGKSARSYISAKPGPATLRDLGFSS